MARMVPEFRKVRCLSAVGRSLVARHDRARQLTEAWARGMAQGGHDVTPDDYADVYATVMHNEKEQAHA